MKSKSPTDQVDVKRTARGQLPKNHIATGAKMQRHPASVSTVGNSQPVLRRRIRGKK